MKKYKALTALLLALSVFLSSAYAAPSYSDAETYRLEPKVSEGISFSESSEGSLEILAHEDGDELIFDETKELSFTLQYSAGWLACDRYSSFFPGDDRACVTALGGGLYLCVFSAAEGGSVSKEEWGSAVFNASVSELPKLYIDASVPFDEIDRENWVDADFSLTLGTKEFESGEYEGTGKVKGRGNSSWTYPKKPYSIKLSSKASLLDIPKTKKYAVVPSYWDGSLMRNYITYKVWQGLEGIGYVPKCEFVDVYLNGEYNGIYILVERVDIESNKIDIEEADEDDLTGGYLIEKDINGKFDFETDLWFNCPYWANIAQDYFVIKAPEPEEPELADAMKSWLTDYMQRVHDCIMGVSGEDYLNYVDTSSWVDFIIVQEVSKNIDGNMKTSCFMYKESGDDRLYMTAPWDFDFAYGRVSWNNQSEAHNDVYDCPNADTPDGFMCVNSSNPWMDRLYDTKPEFRRALTERYTLYRGTLIEDMFALIDEQAAYLSVVQEPNHELWGMAFHASVNNLKSWLADRIEWLDGEWLVSGPSQGDADGNGTIDMQDALIVLRAAMGLADPEALIPQADMNGDGAIGMDDALTVLRIAMGLLGPPPRMG